MPVATPPVIATPFAENAAAPYITLIPATTATPGRASMELGFPPLTMTEIIAGGVPPFGQDVNGILYMVTANIAALTAGQPYVYNSAVATAIGGYSIGTVLGMADGTGLWKNTAVNNTTDPDAGGADWVALYRYGYTLVGGLTGGTATLDALQAASPVIVLSGALVNNLQVELPGQLRSWLIVNNTTGAFSTTVKTAAGTGVLIPQGGYAEPVEVYSEGVNIYPTVTPLTIASAVAATPDTFAVRDNLGQIFVSRLNSSAALTNPAIGAVIVESDALDGYQQKMSPANFWAGLAGAQSLGLNGAYRLPGGLIIKWGTVNCPGNARTTVTYPVGPTFPPFVSFSRPVCSGGQADDPGAQDNAPAVIAAGTANFTMYNSRDGVIPTWWIAVGV